MQDRDGAKLVVNRFKKLKRKLKIIWADQGYRGQLVDWVKQRTGITLQIVERKRKSERSGGFEVLPKRWIVERTFAWLCNYRRLSKNYECREDTAEAFIRLAMTHIMVRRLCPGGV